MDLQKQVEITNKAGLDLGGARIAEIEAVRALDDREILMIGVGVEGSNQKERDTNIRVACVAEIKALDKAKIERIAKTHEYSNAKRTLRIMELIYKVENE